MACQTVSFNDIDSSVLRAIDCSSTSDTELATESSSSSSSSSASNVIHRIQSLESAIDNAYQQFCRMGYALNSRYSVDTRILRVFVHHEYRALTYNDRPHFLIKVTLLHLFVFFTTR